MYQKNDNNQKTIVFHLNTIGSLIIFISLPDELYNEPKSMKFFHKCENNQVHIKIKGKNNNLLIDYKYNFKNNSLSVINIKNTLPKIISISSDKNINIIQNKIKYIAINYSITKSTVNDYFFSDKIINFDSLYDYLEKIIEKKIQKSFKKLSINSICCKNCKKNYSLKQKEIIFDYDSIRIEQNFEEFFNCQNNFNSFMKNKEATQGIENLTKTYEIKYNLDNIYLWIFDNYLNNDTENTEKNDMDIINEENVEKLIQCENCKEILGKIEEHSNILFNKIFFNSINIQIYVDNNKEMLIDLENNFTDDYLNILLVYSINKGNKFLKFINSKKQKEIIFETKMNIVGLIDKDNVITNDNIFFIDNYINMFEVVVKNIETSEIYKEDLIEKIYLNENDFDILQNIIEENINKYITEFFFYKLLTNEIKKFYCFSFPKKDK